MRKNPQIFWSLVIIFIISVSFLLFKKDNNEINFIENSDLIEEIIPLGEGQEISEGILSNNFRHKILGFSFEYNPEYNISSFGEFFSPVGETILIQKYGEGIQVLITPFEEDLNLTTSKIKKDLPLLDIKNPKEQKIGQTEINAVFFESTNALSIGNTYEVWFIFNKNLYQISGSINHKELFDKIIRTWKLD